MGSLLSLSGSSDRSAGRLQSGGIRDERGRQNNRESVEDPRKIF